MYESLREFTDIIKPDRIYALALTYIALLEPTLHFCFYFISEFDMRFSDYCFVMFRHLKKGKQNNSKIDFSFFFSLELFLHS